MLIARHGSLVPLLLRAIGLTLTDSHVGVFIAMAVCSRTTIADPAPGVPNAPALLLVGLGFTPENLVAAGLTVQQGSEFLRAVLSRPGELSQVAAKRDQFDLACKAREAIEARLRNEGSSDGIEDMRRVAGEECVAKANAFRAAFLSFRNDVCEHLAQPLGAQQIELLSRMFDNLDKQVPTRFRCLQLTADQWHTLESAIGKLPAHADASVPGGAPDSNGAQGTISDAEAAMLQLAGADAQVQAVDARLRSAAMSEMDRAYAAVLATQIQSPPPGS